MKRTRLAYALCFIALLTAEVCIALFIRDSFIRPYVGDALVTVLICCFLRVLFPKGLSFLPLLVFFFASCVEASQYFDIVKLMGLEDNLLISTIIGRTFSFADIVCYGAGCTAFSLFEKALLKSRRVIL